MDASEMGLAPEAGLGEALEALTVNSEIDLLGQEERELIPPPLPPQEGLMQKFRLYETRSKYYMIGRNKTRTFWRVLKIDRTEHSELHIHEDSTTYTERDCSDLLRRIHEGNRSTGGLKFVTTCYGIVGLIKFLGPYYMLIITKRRQIGAICGHTIYAIAKSELITLSDYAVGCNMDHYESENRYKKLLCMVDLTKDFFFSYSYRVMRSLQKNMSGDETGQVLYENEFVWNEFLTRGIRNLLQNTLWTVGLVHGFFKQATLSISGREFKLTLIARRSRHYAGTRYLKRGVNEKGRVANDVETEQIVFEDDAEGSPLHISSAVQNRGSIPLFWSQETSRLNLKPDIMLSKRDQTYQATRLHFENLVKRYGNPIIIFNLIKTHEKRPRESILRSEFANAIEHINKDLSEENRLRFLHWDLSKHSRSKATNVLLQLGKVASYALSLTGFYYCQVTPSLRSDGCLKWPYLEKALTIYSRLLGHRVLLWGLDIILSRAASCLVHIVNLCPQSPMPFSAALVQTNSKYYDLMQLKRIIRRSNRSGATNKSSSSGHFNDENEEQHDKENENSDESETEVSGDNGAASGNLLVKPPMFQKGVLRTNCIDCLDRTNVAQYAYGLVALGHQLRALGASDTSKLDLDDPLADELMQFYERMGDTLAHQYGGSAAHNKIFSARRGQWKAAIQSQEFLRTLQRYYNNAYLDVEKQNAINVFLGHFQPQRGKPDVWELDSDQHHNVGRNGQHNVDDAERSVFKRTFSDRNILQGSRLHMLALKIGKDLSKSNLSDQSQGDHDILPESTTEISTCESDITYSRYTPSMPTREIFSEMQPDQRLDHENGDTVDYSNFVDLDWLSSSGNSCDEEVLERIMLTNSPTAALSSENIVREIEEASASSSEFGSSMKGRVQTRKELSVDDGHSYEVPEEFSDSFVRWVNYGETICY